MGFGLRAASRGSREACPGPRRGAKRRRSIASVRLLARLGPTAITAIALDFITTWVGYEDDGGLGSNACEAARRRKRIVNVTDPPTEHESRVANHGDLTRAVRRSGELPTRRRAAKWAVSVRAAIAPFAIR
jgi:hypothetical protein